MRDEVQNRRGGDANAGRGWQRCGSRVCVSWQCSEKPVTGPRRIEGISDYTVNSSSPVNIFEDQRVARAAATARILLQRAALDKIKDVAVRCVLRALGELGPFR